MLRAAFEGSIIAASLIKAGSANAEVTAALVKVADAYGVKAIADGESDVISA